VGLGKPSGAGPNTAIAPVINAQYLETKLKQGPRKLALLGRKEIYVWNNNNVSDVCK